MQRMENITLTKGSLMERVPEGEYAFNTACKTSADRDSA